MKKEPSKTGRATQACQAARIASNVPLIDQMRRIDLRIVTLPIESQKIITKDNVSVDVAAVAYYQVIDPIRSVVEIENVVSAIYQIAQTTVRNIVGQSSLDDVLSVDR